MANLRVIPNGVTDNCYRVVRILNEYENKEEAYDDLFKLLQGKLTEEDLLKNFKSPYE